MRAVVVHRRVHHSYSTDTRDVRKMGGKKKKQGEGKEEKMVHSSAYD